MFSLQFLNVLRADEIDAIAPLLPAPPARLLDLGAGSGIQSDLLSRRGFVVDAIDTEASNYRDAQVYRVATYDGRTIPFGDGFFDIVYSSNVLEHVSDLDTTLGEVARVLKPTGVAIHVLPTGSWRVWTTVSAFVDAPLNAFRRLLAPEVPLPRRFKAATRALAAPFFQRRHGERGNILTEALLFRPSAWRARFREAGWRVTTDRPVGLFYTGNMVLGRHLSLDSRRRLARALRSSCQVFVLER